MHIAVSKGLFDDATVQLSPELAHTRGWVFHQTTYPVIDVAFTGVQRTSLRLQMDFDGWDDDPPSIRLLDASGAPLGTLPSNPTNVFNASSHPSTGLPFVCMAGSREFHTHPSHVNEPWSQYRGKPGFEIGDIIHKLWRAWLRGKG